MALLIIIYIGFISLGIPDSLIGSAWPAIYREFEVPSEYLSYVTFLISLCTVLSSFFSGKVLQRFGNSKVAAFSTLATAVALLGFSFATNIVTMWLWAVPLGFGAGAIDAGLNDYITQHYEAKHVNLLHAFYGIGVTCSPLLMSMALADNSQWRLGYRYAFILQATITVILFLSFPLWSKKKASDTATEEEMETRALSFREMVKMPELRLTWLVVFFMNAIECICNSWGSTYLATVKEVSANVAATMISAFYIGLTLGRLISGVISKKILTWNRIYISIALIGVAIVIMLLPLGTIFSAVAFFLIGLGIGPVYPNMLYLTPHNFGKEVSGSIMGTQIAFAYIGYIVTPVIFGWVQKGVGMEIYSWFILGLFVLMGILLAVLVRKLKKNGKYSSRI